jgi:hypothetical protein
MIGTFVGGPAGAVIGAVLFGTAAAVGTGLILNMNKKVL